LRVAAAWRETEADLGDGEGDTSLTWPLGENSRLLDCVMFCGELWVVVLFGGESELRSGAMSNKGA